MKDQNTTPTQSATRLRDEVRREKRRHYDRTRRAAIKQMATIVQLHNLDDATLGCALKNYMTDTIHNNWDGWEEHEKVGAKALLEDLWGNIKNGLLNLGEEE